MARFLAQVLQTILFFIATLVGLIITVTLVVSAVITLSILALIARFKGRQFSAKDYWQTQRQQAQQKRDDFAQKFSGQKKFSKPKESEVTDVEMRDL